MTGLTLQLCDQHARVLQATTFWRAVRIARECSNCWIEEATA